VAVVNVVVLVPVNKMISNSQQRTIPPGKISGSATASSSPIKSTMLPINHGHPIKSWHGYGCAKSPGGKSLILDLICHTLPS